MEGEEERAWSLWPPACQILPLLLSAMRPWANPSLCLLPHLQDGRMLPTPQVCSRISCEDTRDPWPGGDPTAPHSLPQPWADSGPRAQHFVRKAPRDGTHRVGMHWARGGQGASSSWGCWWG